MNTKQLFLNADVTYTDINLHEYRGKIVAVKTTKNGGDCLVQWAKFPFPSEEHSCNLRIQETNK